LKDEAELQVYFNRRMQSMVKKHGKTIVGWDEIIEEGLEDKAVGMVWHNKEKAFKATSQGHDVVLIYTDYLYFDFPESSIPGEVKAATWMPPISLEKVYHFNPVIEGMDAKYRLQVLGAQAALWSDQFIHGTILQDIAPINENRSEAYFDYLAFPRMSALAEVVWTQQSLQSWEGFEHRMQTHYNRYDQAGYGYRVPQPKLVKKEKTDDGFIIELENVVHGAEIRFNTDGIKPNVYSEIYTKPIEIRRLQDFQAITVVNRRHYSLPLYFPVSYPQFKEYGTILGEWRAKDVLADQVMVLERNATGKIKKNGTYELTFLHTDGDTQLEIEGITVYKNGHIFTDDMHAGKTGKLAESNTYSFKVDNYETGAAFKIKANILGVGGNDSNGVIFIKLKE
ncbi:MAG: family 20 glycosylhydrolase, partial [Cyclobacteriaceae bacterium]|nr:family 20 glycosylhydrolase [Cyclobacteriaceae bacterium]